VNLRVATLADPVPSFVRDTTKANHLEGLPSKWEGTYVDFPQSQLVVDIPEHTSFTMMTTGLIVCSAVAIGFARTRTDSYGVFMSHTTPALIQNATANILHAVSTAELEGYEPVFQATIGPNSARYAPGHESLRGMLALILDTTLDTIPDTRYHAPTRWDFIKTGDSFQTVAS
jgi:hypothetical protein